MSYKKKPRVLETYGNAPKIPVFRFEPRSPAQREAFALYPRSDLLFLLGPAGTGKTAVALALALTDYFNRSCPRKHILVSRPVVPTGPKVGFLPGDMNEKTQELHGPIDHCLSKMVLDAPPGLIDFQALTWMRGCTFDDAVIILDEAQNADLHSLKMFITRLGKNSKLIISGDPDQSDIPTTGSHRFDTDLDFMVDRFTHAPGVQVVEFPEKDNLRNPRLNQWLPLLKDDPHRALF